MRSRRNIELALLLASAPVVLLAFALVHGEAHGELGWPDLAVPAALLLAFLAAHLATRLLAPRSDPALLPIAAMLSGLGLAFVTRLDPARAASQAAWLLIGVGVMVATLVLVPSLERLARYKYTVMLTGLALLLLPAVIGREVNGAKLWLRVGDLSFQPAEVAKILVVLFLAAYLAENREVLSVSTRRFAGLWLPPARHLGPLVAMWAVSLVVLVFERDLGGSLLFFGVFLLMLFVATGRSAYVLAGVALFGAGASAAYVLFSHVQTRISVWLDPFADPQGRGYQLLQSLFALGAGGMAGTGIGKGLPDRIPYVTTDFIFTAIAEEIGLVGAAAIVLACLVLCLRGLAVATRARSDVAAFTATGLVAAFGLQVFVIVGGVTRLVPLTGVTLPFVSYGGSSVLANFMLLALLMRAGDAGVAEGVELLSSSETGVLGRVSLAKRLRGAAGVLSLLLTALVVNLTYIQVVAAPALAADPANTRQLAAELRMQRGAILTSDGVVLARSVPAGRGRYSRRYPAGDLAAHVVGYFSPRFGRSGIEAAMNVTLTGQRSFATFRDYIDAAAGRPVAGNDVVLTIDSRVQRAAQRALAGHRGACVVLDPRTGAVLAMASSPSYRPGTVRESDFASSDPAAPLVDRATRSLYPPGSTFKIVTLTGALMNRVVTPETTYPAPGTLSIGGGKVTNFEGGAFGTATVRRATTSSINTVFAQVAVDLGARRLVEQARAFGFGERPPLEIPVKTSRMSDPDEMTTWETAWAGVGQPVGQHEGPTGPAVTPLQMALVASGIANRGVVMRPYVVERVDRDTGETLTLTHPRDWKVATPAGTADTVLDIMVDAVRAGSGRRASIAGVPVAGKTGTAEIGKHRGTHAWFIAFAPADKAEVAVALVLEEAGIGGRVAAPAAKGVLEEALAVR